MSTIMEALGGQGGQTIMEVLGGQKGQTIAEVIEETGLTPVTPEPEPTVKYTVTFDLAGGSGTIDPIEVVAGESITLPGGSAITPPQDKTTFDGWTTIDASPVTSPFTPEDDVTLYAKWSSSPEITDPQE